MNVLSSQLIFLSTPSARRATVLRVRIPNMITISIHALREEGDRRRLRPDGLQGHFYPRPPRGGRLQECQSFPLSFRISIHALREEGDISIGCLSIAMRYFYPRPPRGGRPSSSLGNAIRLEISIHALREEGDLCVHHFHNFVLLFLSTPSVRRATCEVCCGRRCTGVFLSTPSARRATWSGPWRRPSHRHFYPRPP